MSNNNFSNKLNIQALFTDLDGTLVYKNKLSKINADACKKLASAGIPIIFTTGRDISSVKKYLIKTGLDKINGYVSCVCGALIYKLPEMKLIKEYPITSGVMNQFIQECHLQKINFALYGINKIYIGKTSIIHKIINRSFSNSRLPIEYYFDKQMQVIKNDNIYKIITYFPDNMINAEKNIKKVNFLRDKFEKKLSTYFGNSFFTEVTDIAANKGNSMDYIAKLLNVNLEHIAFIGDGNNDVSAMKKAGYKIALANSIPEIMQQANLIVPHCKKNGFAFTVNKLFLI